MPDLTLIALNLQLTAYAVQVHQEIDSEQVSHPLADYTPERTARLWEQIEEARRFTWPAQFMVNL
jgi:hypothetical protein